MEEQIKTAPQTDVEVVDIQFRPGQKIYFFDPDGQRFADGDHIIIDTARGEEFGICVGGNHKIPPKNVVAPLRKVLRRATPQDEKTIQENRAKEKRAFEVCQQKIAEHGLDMQLVNAEVAFDGSKILFYFTADGQNYHCDIDNLDPNASYRVTISYDSSRYYLYGLMKVEGIG